MGQNHFDEALLSFAQLVDLALEEFGSTDPVTLGYQDKLAECLRKHSKRQSARLESMTELPED